jgi:hypothetical protein
MTMRRLVSAAVALGLLVAALAVPRLALAQVHVGVSPAQLFACNRSAQYSGGAATTKLVTGISGTQIYVCGFVFAGNAAAGTAALEYGATGGSCPSPTLITPVFGVGAATNPGLVDHPPTYGGLPPVPGVDDLCVVTTGTATQVVVYYTQF